VEKRGKTVSEHHACSLTVNILSQLFLLPVDERSKMPPRSVVVGNAATAFAFSEKVSMHVLHHAKLVPLQLTCVNHSEVNRGERKSFMERCNADCCLHKHCRRTRGLQHTFCATSRQTGGALPLLQKNIHAESRQKREALQHALALLSAFVKNRQMGEVLLPKDPLPKKLFR
jgi:hypothetical protein